MERFAAEMDGVLGEGLLFNMEDVYKSILQGSKYVFL